MSEKRRRTHELVSARLAKLTDDDLTALLASEASWRDHAHGGRSGVIEVEGVKVFVKHVALTDLERSPANEGSTANLFGLPLFYQYGIGSAGFGAWRELEACLAASAWALTGECPSFPLIYHWRVAPRAAPAPSAEQHARRDLLVAYWDNSDAVRVRLEAIQAASASIVLFLEYVPETAHQWMVRELRRESRDPALEPTILAMHDQLQDAAAFMNQRGLLHFDLNPYNVLTDGQKVYAADFGLALSSDFALSSAEQTFFEAHRLYDRAYVSWAFVEWLAPQQDPPVLTPALRALVDRHAPVAMVMGRFFHTLREESKRAPYPRAELEAALPAQATLT